MLWYDLSTLYITIIIHNIIKYKSDKLTTIVPFLIRAWNRKFFFLGFQFWFRLPLFIFTDFDLKYCNFDYYFAYRFCILANCINFNLKNIFDQLRFSVLTLHTGFIYIRFWFQFQITISRNLGVTHLNFDFSCLIF